MKTERIYCVVLQNFMSVPVVKQIFFKIPEQLKPSTKNADFGSSNISTKYRVSAYN